MLQANKKTTKTLNMVAVNDALKVTLKLTLIQYFVLIMN